MIRAAKSNARKLFALILLISLVTVQVGIVVRLGYCGLKTNEDGSPVYCSNPMEALASHRSEAGSSVAIQGQSGCCKIIDIVLGTSLSAVVQKSEARMLRAVTAIEGLPSFTSLEGPPYFTGAKTHAPPLAELLVRSTVLRI
jgi:hypothetical protein